VASEDQVIVAAEVTTSPIEVAQLEPLVAVTRTNLAAAGMVCPIGTVLADAGYYSTTNAAWSWA
jgi:hypothetical protein